MGEVVFIVGRDCMGLVMDNRIHYSQLKQRMVNYRELNVLKKDQAELSGMTLRATLQNQAIQGAAAAAFMAGCLFLHHDASANAECKAIAMCLPLFN